MRRALPVALLLALGTGCVLLPVLGGPPPREDEDAAQPLLHPGGLADLRGIVHCHSRLSHDCRGSFESIADAAAETSCSFVALCDHLTGRTDVRDEPDGRVNGVLLIPGAEVNCNGGSLLAIGVAAGIDRHRPPDDVVRQIREKGGVALIGHAESIVLAGLTDVDGCELENVHADTLDESKLSVALRFLVLPPRPFFSSLIDRSPSSAAVYDAFARTRSMAAVGACDAHEAIRPLGPLAGAADSYRRLFRAATTHVLVPAAATGEALTKAVVLDALRKGRTYAASELTRDATGFRFFARCEDRIEALPGDEASIARGPVLEAVTPAPGTLTLLRDGAATITSEGTSLRFRPRVPGAYRVEVTRDGKPWIWSSSIRVVPGDRR